MRDLFSISVRPYEAEKDEKILNRWRDESKDVNLEIPFGYEKKVGVMTNSAVSGDGRLLGSLTGLNGLILDPFIRNREAGSAELLQALFALTRSTELIAMRAGAQASFITIPNELEDYQKLVEKCGFSEIDRNCKIYRHPFYAPRA